MQKTEKLSSPSKEDPLLKKWVLAPEVEWTMTDEEVIVLDAGQDKFFGLNEVGGAIWNGLNDGLLPWVIVNNLEKEYNIEKVSIEADVRDMILLLFANRLIEPADDRAGGL